VSPTSPGAPDAHEPRTTAELLEEDASLAAVAVAGALRALQVAIVVFVGLLVCPPLAIAAFVVVTPLLVAALVLGLLTAVVYTPYLLVQHIRGHHAGGHVSLLAHRLHLAGRALLALAPHRIVADARTARAQR
jgi:hypothetical protein